MPSSPQPDALYFTPYMSDKLGELLGEEKQEARSNERFREKRRSLAAIAPATRVFKIAGDLPKTKLHRELYDAHESPMQIGELIWKEG